MAFEIEVPERRGPRYRRRHVSFDDCDLQRIGKRRARRPKGKCFRVKRVVWLECTMEWGTVPLDDDGEFFFDSVVKRRDKLGVKQDERTG